ncbi:MAG: glutamate synthase-related protein [Candidatus Geothermarchaeales archaeon]
MPIIGAYCVNVFADRCTDCGLCVEVCPHDVYAKDKNGRVKILNDMACVGCRICMEFCPTDAVHVRPAEPEYITRSLWTLRAVEEIHYKAQTGDYMLRGFGTTGPTPHFDSLVVVPSQLASPPPIDKYREECNVGVTIGEGRVEEPMRLKIPVMLAAMSFGAVSLEAKKAMAIAAAKMGTATNTGEGGAIPGEYHLAHGYEDLKSMGLGKQKYKPGGYLIVQWSTGRWGVNLDYLRDADAIEIKIGQGAKPGMGGHLLGQKVIEAIARVRGLPVGTDALSPPRFYDAFGSDDLKKQVELLRDVTDYRVPITLKLGPSRPYEDVRMAVEMGVDAVAIDGMVGGTGCSPELVTQGVGIPTIACIPPAAKALEDAGVSGEVKLVAMGGIRDGLDAMKALALGADAVAVASAAEIALGCRACMACHKGRCPYGIATNDPELRKRLNPEIGGQRLANFLRAMTEEVKMLTTLAGHNDISQLSREDLRALDVNAATLTGVKLAGLGP